MMDLLPYWPTLKHIAECIRTEAEELTEHTLLAVHEPMLLRRDGLSGSEILSDKDLLKEFLQVERPIPVIGRSGVGKSHLLRWLHAKLRVHPETSNWHIVRIPKNASLRQVLELLLLGLEGETFELARQQVKNVGEKLKTREVAELLLTFMGLQLQKRYDEAITTIEDYRRRKVKPDDDEYKRLKVITTHCGERGLSSLIKDPYFQTFLLNPEHCVYQFGKRLTSGASDDELDDYDYTVHAKDLDFNYNLNDLSIQSRQYVSSARLNTNESMRQEAADMLNLVLGVSTRTLFQQLFQFGGNNFQELFKQIRKDLYAKGQTLVVLVEDMAAISAIEDVLIDSLMEEGLYDGVETMCSLRSAIAVTDGYPGYLRRRDTLYTRAKAEWRIQEIQENETDQVTVQRVVNLCSRYINAGRHGSDALKRSWKEIEESNWPPIWEDKEVDREHLDAFGRAETRIPLFPFSHKAIFALANENCRDNDTGRLRFNPRQIINQILLKIPRDCRLDAEKNQFPPPSLCEIYAPGTMRGDLARLGLAERQRCETLSAIWGYKARNLEDLRKLLSADIASCFGLDDLATHLKSGTIDAPPTPLKEGNKREGKEISAGSQDTIKDKLRANPEERQLEVLFENVDLWCHKQQELGQDEARKLRNALTEMYETYARKEWAGVGNLPPIRKGPFQKIRIPYAAGNTVGNSVDFCTEKNFTDKQTSIIFHDTARALLRNSYHNPRNGEKKGWNYEGGYTDFLHYQNFAALWVPDVLRTLREYERENIDDNMAKHVASARALAVFKDSDSHQERINKLLQSKQTLNEKFPTPVCNTVLTERQEQLDLWDSLQEGWCQLVSSNDHGIEGDLAIKALKKAMKKPPQNRINQLVERSLDELSNELLIVGWLADCSSPDDLNYAFQNLDLLIKQLRTSGNYPPNDESIVTSQTLSRRINALVDSRVFEQKQRMERLNSDLEVEVRWQILNELDGDKVTPLLETFNKWQVVYGTVLPLLKNENSMWGADRVKVVKNSIDTTLSSLQKTIDVIQGESNGNN